MPLVVVHEFRRMAIFLHQLPDRLRLCHAAELFGYVGYRDCPDALCWHHNVYHNEYHNEYHNDSVRRFVSVAVQ